MLRTTLLRAVTGTVALSLGLYAWADSPATTPSTPPTTNPSTQPAKAKFLLDVTHFGRGFAAAQNDWYLFIL